MKDGATLSDFVEIVTDFTGHHVDVDKIKEFIEAVVKDTKDTPYVKEILITHAGVIFLP